MRVTSLLCLIAFAVPAPAMGIAVGGRIGGDDASPLAGARVELAPLPSAFARALALLDDGGRPEPLAAATTDAAGRFSLPAPGSGIFQVTVRATGFVPMRYAPLPLVQDAELPPLSLVADAGTHVAVVDAAGAPVAGVRVVAQSASGATWGLHAADGWQVAPRHGATDEQGELVLPRAGGERLAVEVFRLPSLPLGRAQGEDRIRLGLAAAPGGPWGLAIRDAEDRPVPGVVAVERRSGWPAGVSDEEGGLALRGAPPGPVTLDLWTVDGRRRPVALPTAPSAPVRVVLSGSVEVSGRILGAADRRPLPSVLVWPGSDPGRYTVTDGQGSYALRAAPDDDVTLLIQAAGWRTDWVRLQAPAADPAKAPTVALQPSATFRGRAVDRTGAALADVDLAALPVSPRPRSPVLLRDRADVRAVSDATGAFRLAGLHPEARYEVVATAPGFIPAQIAVDAPGVEAGGGLIVLEPARGARGRVVDAEDRPVADAEVLLRAAGAIGRRPPAAALSGADGRFSIPLVPARRFSVEVRKQGFAELALRGVEPPPGDGPAELGTLVLEPAATVAGRVADARGEPLAGVAVYRVKAGDAAPLRQVAARVARETPRAVTDAAGRFTLEDLAAGDVVDLLFLRPRWLPERVSGLEAPNPSPLEVVLRPAARLAGQVIDGAGQPVAGARVLVRDAPPPPGTLGVRPLTRDNLTAATTDADGRFAVPDLLPGVVEVTASAEGFLPPRPIAVELPEGAEEDGIDFVLERGAVVEGRVTDLNATPLADVRLRVMEARTTSDADGVFRLAGVAPGSRVLFAQHAEYETLTLDFEVEPGVNTRDLVLKGGSPVSGRVVSEQGDGIAGARVVLRSGGTEARSYPAMAGENGSFHLPQVVNGVYDVAATRAGYAPAMLARRLEVRGEAVTDLEVVLAPGVTLGGRILGLDRRDLASVEVEASPQGGEVRRGTLDAQGRYEIADLAPGVVRVRAWTAGGRRQAEARVVIEPGVRRAERDLELDAGLTLRGEVLYEGVPLPETSVVLNGRDVAAQREATTDYRGAFTLEGLPPGRYWVSVANQREMLSHNEEFELFQDQQARIEIRTTRLAGAVISATTERPVANALVMARQLIGPERSEPASLMTVATDHRGRFLLARLSPGRYRLEARRFGYATAAEVVDLEAGEPGEIVLALSPTAGLEMEVRLASGAVPGAAGVALLGDDGRPVRSFMHLLGADGRVHLASLAPGTWSVWVGAPGTAPAKLEVTVPGDPVAVVLSPAARLQVRVPDLMASDEAAALRLFDAAGNPFWNLGPTGSFQEEWRLARGAGTVDGVPPGLWTLRVTTADGGAWQTQVTVADPGDWVVTVR